MVLHEQLLCSVLTFAVAPSAPEATTPVTSDPETSKRSVTFQPGAQVWLRGFGRVNPDLANDGGTPNQGGVLQRIRLQLKAGWGPLSAFAQVQDARGFGTERGTASNEANTDLHQGYLQVRAKKGKASGYLRAGRQEISVGDQRLIGPLDWAPNARAFDALSLHGEYDNVYVDLFGALLAPPRVVTEAPADPLAPAATANAKGDHLGGLIVGARLFPALNLELNGLVYSQDAQDEAVTFDRLIGNTGARVWGEPLEGLTYSAEGNYQFGKVNRRAHRAWAWTAGTGYTYKPAKFKPGALVRYSMASGEACVNTVESGDGCGGNKDTEFFNFFPTNHMHYGFIDLLGWRNMRSLEASVFVGLPPVLGKLALSYHLLQLQEPRGRWSGAGGQTIGQGWQANATNRNLGHEIDIFAVIKPYKNFLMLQPGYAVFLPAGAGRNLGGDDAQHFLWLWVILTI